MFKILILIISSIGFLISSFLFLMKRKKKKIPCLAGDSCNLVLYSRYNKIFGIANELIGSVYYLGIGITVFWSFLRPEYDSRLYLLIWPASVALIFSLYLFFVQWRKLKAWCEWCIITAFINLLLLIFILRM